ncbi:type II secretion system F family protein [Planomonospora sp. ID67723]|uniref:type II secretion system F family protein n=1 Tax=Planomonospora sp. ID67723 TaxID=2738134 RepID=UPI0018C3E71A|nr:type II secretion system F family protein [Planomonospora sp. ID67723]MBG0833278.1 type II secretion system F family protein [Planomonospora sp. ID67723]
MRFPPVPVRPAVRVLSALFAVLLTCAVLTATVLGAVPAPAAWADGEPSLAVGAVRTTPGQAQFYLTARNLPPGMSLETARVTVRAEDTGGGTGGGTVLPVTVEPAGTPGTGGDGPARSVVIVFDASASMSGPPLDQAQDAALDYARAVPADVRIGLVRVGERAETLLAPTADRAAFTAAVRGVRARGSTALYDGVMAGRELLAGEDGDRRLLVLSDGADTSSQTSLDRLVVRLGRDGAAVDVVALGERTDGAALRRIAEGGGGRVHRATGGRELAGAFLSAAAAFSPPVRVTVQVPAELAGRTARMTVEARAGGSATAAPAPAATPSRTGTPPVAGSGGTASTSVTVTFAAVPRTGGPGAPPAAVTVAGPPAWLYPAGGGALLAALVMVAAVLVRPHHGLDGGRLAQLERLAAYGSGPAGGAGGGVLGVPGAALALTEKVVRARGRHERIAVELEQAGMRLLPHEWTLLRLGVAFACAVLLTLLLSPVAGILLGPGLGWAGCAFYRRRRAAARARRFAEQLPDALQLVVGSLRSGFSLGQALAALVRESAEPVSTEFGKALAETRLGVDLEDALEKAAERTACRDLSWLVMAIRIQREVGGNLAEIMATAVDTMRERARLRRHVRALTAEGRLSAYVLIALPIGIGGWMFLIRGEYVRPLYTEPLGIAMLSAAVLLVAVGSFWMSRLIKVEV